MKLNRRQILSSLSLGALAISSRKLEAAAHFGPHDAGAASGVLQPPPVGHITLRSSGMTAAVRVKDKSKDLAMDFAMMEVASRPHYPTLEVPRAMIAPAGLGVKPDAVSSGALIWNLVGKNVDVIAAAGVGIVVRDAAPSAASKAGGEPLSTSEWASLAWALDLQALGGAPIDAGWRKAAATAAIVRVGNGATIEPPFGGSPADEDKVPGRYSLNTATDKVGRAFKDSVRVRWTTSSLTLRFTDRATGKSLGDVVAQYQPGHPSNLRLSNLPADWLHRTKGTPQTDFSAHGALLGLASGALAVPTFISTAAGHRAGGCDCCLQPTIVDTVATLPGL